MYLIFQPCSTLDQLATLLIAAQHFSYKFHVININNKVHNRSQHKDLHEVFSKAKALGTFRITIHTTCYQAPHHFMDAFTHYPPKNNKLWRSTFSVALQHGHIVPSTSSALASCWLRLCIDYRSLSGIAVLFQPSSTLPDSTWTTTVSTDLHQALPT